MAFWVVCDLIVSLAFELVDCHEYILVNIVLLLYGISLIVSQPLR